MVKITVKPYKLSKQKIINDFPFVINHNKKTKYLIFLLKISQEKKGKNERIYFFFNKGHIYDNTNEKKNTF